MNRRFIIGYVRHAKDNRWKPVYSKEQFMAVLMLPKVREIITSLRTGHLPKEEKQKMKTKLAGFCFMGMTADGQEGFRKKSGMVPTGLVMIDFDCEDGEAKDIYDQFLRCCPGLLPFLLFAHRSPSGHGLHLVLVIPMGKDIEQMQNEIATAMDRPVDIGCKDISRLSYACLPEDIFFLSDALFEGKITTSKEGEDNTQKVQDSPAQGETLEANAQPCECPMEMQLFPEAYDGVSYKHIVKALTEVMGGRPKHGSRNNYIYNMACHLRYVTGSNPRHIMQIIPTFGERQDKVWASVQSACSWNQDEQFSTSIVRALELARAEHDFEQASDVPEQISNSPSAGNIYALPTPPPMPCRLPPMIALITNNVPSYMVPSLSQMCFPALAAHVSNTLFRYIDNVLHEPSMMQVQVGKTAVGKGYINEPIRLITADIEEEDKEGRVAEDAWRQECAQLGSNKKKPPRPDVSIRMISSNMTNAIFVQRLIDNSRHGQHFMFSKFNEIELLDDISKGISGGRKEVSKVIRLAYDVDDYGQERLGVQSVSGKAPIRWNWVASSTVQNTRRYFRDMIADGTMNRIGFSYAEQQDRGTVPLVGIYEKEYEEALKFYIENLKRRLEPTHQYGEVFQKKAVEVEETGRQIWQWMIADTTQPFIVRHDDERVEVFCPEAYQLAQDLNRENAEMVLLSDDQTFDSFSLRANVIAFKKAMILYLANGCQWDETFGDFIRWSERYDLWCKLQLFGERAQEVLAGEGFVGSRGPRNMLAQLPQIFNKEDLMAARRRAGMSGNVSVQLKNWLKRGYITRTADKQFMKKKMQESVSDSVDGNITI